MIKNYNDILEKYPLFCPHLWQHVSMETNGDAKFCCEATPINENFGQTSAKDIFNSEIWNNARNDLLNNIKLPECAQCWNKEEQGLNSKRIYDRDFIGLEDSFVQTFKDWQQGEEILPNYYNLQVSKTCNYACVMCSTEWSSLLESYNKNNHVLKPGRVRDLDQKQNVSENDLIWKSLKAIDYNLNRLYVTGGEPFLIKKLWKYLESLVERGHSKNVDFWCSTNASIITDKQLATLQNFEAVNLNLSIDAFGEDNEYQRFGSSWQVINENVDKLIDYCNRITNANHIQLTLVPTVSCLSITSLDKLIEWWIEKNVNSSQIKIYPNIVWRPSSMSIWAAPTKVVRKSVNKILKIYKNSNIDESAAERFENLFTTAENHEMNVHYNSILKRELRYFSEVYKKDYLKRYAYLFKK